MPDHILRKEILFGEEVYRIIGAAMDVYYRLGVGFLEPVYQEALEIEFTRREIPFEPQKELLIRYKGIELQKKYKADFCCFGQIIAELKALPALSAIEERQILNYMSMTGIRVGLLINFGRAPKLEWRRYVI